MASDEDVVVSQAKTGDQTAFEDIVMRYERQIYSFVYRMMGNRDDAFDMTQECFTRAYKNIHKTNADLNISAWLHRIASNACLDELRRRKRIRWLPWEHTKHDKLLNSHSTDDPVGMAVSRELSADVQQILNSMTPRNRLALVLREYEGFSTREISEVMGISRSAVKSVLFRGREEFRRLYVEQYGEVQK